MFNKNAEEHRHFKGCSLMRNFVHTILSGATASAGILVLSSPATAAVVLTDVNGPNLPTAIKASTTNTQNNNIVVFGCTLNNGQCANVTFTGNTAMNITDGAGYAQISDAAGGISLTQIVSNPFEDFSAYQFNIQLLQAGNITVEYQLAGSLNWILATPGDITNPFQQNANTNRDYQITATAGESLSALRLTSTGNIDQFKQNSINLIPAVAAVPEPSTWMLMLLGMAGVGFTMRRKDKQTLRVRYT